MSNKLISRALREPIKGSNVKALLMVLCNYAQDKHRLCWPSNDTLALNVGLGVTKVKEGLRKLEALGLVARVSTRLVPPDEKIDRRLHKFVYRVYPSKEDLEWSRDHFGAPAASSSADGLDRHTGDGLDSHTGDGLNNGSGTQDRQTGDGSDRQTGDGSDRHTGDTEPKIEPNIEPKKTTTARVRARDKPQNPVFSFTPSQAHRAQARNLGVDVDVEASKFIVKVNSPGGKIPDDPDLAFTSWLSKGALKGLARKRGTPMPPAHATRDKPRGVSWRSPEVVAAVEAAERERGHGFDRTRNPRVFGPSSEYELQCVAVAKRMNEAAGLVEPGMEES